MNRAVRRPKRLVTLCVPVLLLLGAQVGTGQQAAQGNLRVEITGVRPGKGPVRASLWRTADGFLKGRSYRHAAVTPSADTAGLTFGGLEPGPYAVSAYQDENANGRLDSGFMGKPKEPYGFSNDARRTFGPPAFRAAAFEVTPADTTIRFRLR